jgi:putative transposase
MEQAVKKADKVPKLIITDSNNAYTDAVKTVFGPDTEHIRTRRSGNQLIERLHGTLRKRTKVMRGLKDLASASKYVDGWLIHYNYFRPHEGLGRKTPAELARIECPHKNWADIIQHPQPKHN